MRLNRWLNPSLPQTLQIATFLFYINAGFNVIYGVAFNPIGLLLTVGSVFAALSWLVVSALFSWYLGNFANYNATYGALGAVVGLMMWMWLSTIVVLVGAELNSEIEHQTARDSTVGREKPLGTRGAVMADTVGAAVT